MSTVAANIPLPASGAWRTDSRHALLLGAMLWVLIALMIVPEGFDYQSLTLTSAPSSASAVSRVLWLGLFSMSIAVIAARAGLAWLVVRELNPFLTLFFLLAVCSIGWSIDPSLTSRRLFRMATILLACIAFATQGWHAHRYQGVVRPIVTLMLLGSLAFGLLFPELAIHQETSPELLGAWRGLANHKNGLGALACIGLILWFHAGLSSEAKPFRAIAGCAIAGTCLVLSRSSTSAVAAVFVLVLLLAMQRAPRNLCAFVPPLVTALVAILLLYALALMNLIPGLGALLAPLTALTDVNTTFTGRTDIWWIISEHAARHPLLGTGYGAYWTAGPVAGTDSYEFVLRMGGFYPGSAHNGYLEVLNDLGAAGLTCLFGFIVVQVRQSLQLFDVDRHQGALYLALFFQQAITNLSETHWLSVLSVDFVIMSLAAIALGRGLLEIRLRHYLGEPAMHVRPVP
jgi:O-antigen ligase